MDRGDRAAQMLTALFALLGPDRARTTLNAIDAQVPLDATDRGPRRFALLEAALDAATGGPPASHSGPCDVADGALQGETAVSGVRVSGAKDETPEDERATYWAGMRGYAIATLAIWRVLLRQARGRQSRQAFWTRPALMRWAEVRERHVSSAIARLVADHALTSYVTGQRRWQGRGRRAGSEAVVPPPPPIP